MQKNRTKTMIALVTVLLVGLTTSAYARPGGGEGRRGPPPEAIEACQGKSANAPCSFTGRYDDTLEGTCFAPPDADELACAPEGGPPERGPR